MTLREEIDAALVAGYEIQDACICASQDQLSAADEIIRCADARLRASTWERVWWCVHEEATGECGHPMTEGCGWRWLVKEGE